MGAHTKCAFAVELRVYPKHTNGFGIIQEYRALDTAAVALEKVSCLDLAMSVPRVGEKVELLN